MGKSRGNAWIENFVSGSVPGSDALGMIVHPIHCMTKLEFRHATSHGLKWTNLIVESLTEQALKMGVQVGWKIYKVDNCVCKNDDDVWARLQEAKWEWRSCHVWFITDIRAIRKEQVQLRAVEAKEQEHRLANLPFAGAHDHKHVEQLKEQFLLQGLIERVEDRAITLPQFQTMLDWTKGKCHRWRDFTSMKKLHIDSITMSQLYLWLIRPATKDKDCSMLELITAQKQTPKWFVTHWWGDKLLDLVKTIKTHLEARAITQESTNYWIAACATRPHSGGDGIDLDPKATPFYKAMAAANFHILYCLDRKTEMTGPATPFKRAWCHYETTMCLDNSATVLDLIVPLEARRHLVTMRMTKDEDVQESLNAGAGLKLKADREKIFNLEIVEQALAIQIQNGKSTESMDKQRILNAIALRDLSSGYLPKNDLYTKANIRICALFALVFWRRTMSGASSDSDMLRLQTQVADALRADVWREDLILSMAFMVGGDEKITLLMRSFPPNLKTLRLDLRGMDLTNESIVTLASNVPREIEVLEIDFRMNEQITNAGVEHFANKLPAKIGKFKLELAGTLVSKEMQDQSDSLDRLHRFTQAENEKGNTCITVSLCPSNTRRMVVETTRTKVFPPQT